MTNTAGESRPRTRRRIPASTRAPVILWVLAAGVAGITGAAIGVSFLGQSLAALGIPGPGPATSWGVPLVRSAGTFFACLGIGSFLVSAFGIPARTDGFLDFDGYRAARTGSLSMLAWAICGLLLIPLYLSDVSATPLSQTLHPSMWATAVTQVSTATAMLQVTVIAGVTALISLPARR